MMIVSVILATCYYLFMPFGWYLKWDTLQEYLISRVQSMYINLSPDRLLNQRMTILHWFVTRDFLSRNDYKMVFSWSEELYDFSERNKYAPIFKGFLPLLIKDKCFIFKANAGVLSKSIWGEIRKYKKESPTRISECKINCNVYFTEKWLLSKDDIYSCN